MDSHRASVRAGLVQHEVDALAEFNIGREQILAKWWEFASIDPAKTGYNTNGQSKALDSLWKALGFEGSKKPGEEEPKPEPRGRLQGLLGFLKGSAGSSGKGKRALNQN